MELFIKQADGSFAELWSHRNEEGDINVIPAVEGTDKTNLSFYVKKEDEFQLLTEFSLAGGEHRIHLEEEGGRNLLSIFDANGDDCGFFDWGEDETAEDFESELAELGLDEDLSLEEEVPALKKLEAIEDEKKLSKRAAKKLEKQAIREAKKATKRNRVKKVHHFHHFRNGIIIFSIIITLSIIAFFVIKYLI